MLFQNQLYRRVTAAQSELRSLALESHIPPAGVAVACAAELRNPCVLPASGCRAVAAARATGSNAEHTPSLCALGTFQRQQTLVLCQRIKHRA